MLSMFRTSIFSESGLPHAPGSEEQLIYATQNNWGLVFTHHVIYHMWIQNHRPSKGKAAGFVDKDSTDPVLQVQKLKVSIRLNHMKLPTFNYLFFLPVHSAL